MSRKLLSVQQRAVKLLRLLQRALAHNNLSSTSVYIQADKEEVDEIIRQMKF